MRSKALLLMVLILLLICGGAGSYFYFSGTSSYKNITLSDVIFEVPDSDNNVTKQDEHLSVYNDTEHGVAIIVSDSSDSKNNSTMNDFLSVRDVLQDGAQSKQETNISYNYSDNLKVYFYMTSYTYKNIIIIADNEKDLKHIITSVNTGNVKNEDNNTENSTNNTTETKKKSAKTKSTVREEDQITPDGWNPKEHEVSREKIEDGNERVYYDDGYSRVVNKKGDVLSYGF